MSYPIDLEVTGKKLLVPVRQLHKEGSITGLIGSEDGVFVGTAVENGAPRLILGLVSEGECLITALPDGAADRICGNLADALLEMRDASAPPSAAVH